MPNLKYLQKALFSEGECFRLPEKNQGPLRHHKLGDPKTEALNINSHFWKSWPQCFTYAGLSPQDKWRCTDTAVRVKSSYLKWCWKKRLQLLLAFVSSWYPLSRVVPDVYLYVCKGGGNWNIKKIVLISSQKKTPTTKPSTLPCQRLSICLQPR